MVIDRARHDAGHRQVSSFGCPPTILGLDIFFVRPLEYCQIVMVVELVDFPYRPQRMNICCLHVGSSYVLR